MHELFVMIQNFVRIKYTFLFFFFKYKEMYFYLFDNIRLSKRMCNIINIIYCNILLSQSL